MRKMLLLVLATVTVAGMAHAQGSGDITVNTGGSLNCTTKKGEAGFNVQAWSIGGSATTSFAGGNPTASKPVLSKLSIQKFIDPCSDKLIRNFTAGIRIPTLTLTQYTTGANPYAYVIVTLNQVLLSSYQIDGAVSVVPTESLAFAYAQMCVQTTGQNADGSHQAPVKVCYDAVTNITS